MRTTNSFENFIKIITSPYFLLVWAAIAIFSYFYIDQPVAYFMHDLQIPLIKNIAKVLTLFGYGGPYLIILFFAFIITRFITKNKIVANKVLFLLTSVISASILCDILKMLLGRSRPVHLFATHMYGFHFFQTTASMWSFPSGHATIIATMMIGLSYLFPRYWVGFVIMILLTSLSRLILTAHFVSDVMAGMYLGAMTTIMIHALLQRSGVIAVNQANATS